LIWKYYLNPYENNHTIHSKNINISKIREIQSLEENFSYYADEEIISKITSDILKTSNHQIFKSEVRNNFNIDIKQGLIILNFSFKDKDCKKWWKILDEKSSYFKVAPKKDINILLDGISPNNNLYIPKQNSDLYKSTQIIIKGINKTLQSLTLSIDGQLYKPSSLKYNDENLKFTFERTNT
jgi:hypothetical protein